jgi:hypothetical protein
MKENPLSIINVAKPITITIVVVSTILYLGEKVFFSFGEYITMPRTISGLITVSSDEGNITTLESDTANITTLESDTANIDTINTPKVQPQINLVGSVGDDSKRFAASYVDTGRFRIVESLDNNTSLILRGRGTGSVSIEDALLLATSGGTAAALNHYEEYTPSTFDMSGPFNTQAIPARLTRIGRVVTFEFGSTATFAGNSTSTYIACSGSSFLPSRLRPNAETKKFIYLQENATNVNGVLTIYTTGEVRIFKYNATPSSTSFISTTGNFQIPRQAVTYTVS